MIKTTIWDLINCRFDGYGREILNLSPIIHYTLILCIHQHGPESRLLY
jgi:hypothetical protein